MTTIENAKIEYKAYLISENLEIQEYLKKHNSGLIYSGASELYYSSGKNKFLLILSYGVCVFANYDQREMDLKLTEISHYAKNLVPTYLSDELLLKIVPHTDQIDMKFDSLTLGRFDYNVNKAIMLNLGQSVCLDFYFAGVQDILEQLKESGSILGKHGKISLSKRKVMQLAGKSLETKNAIAENLYILDSPEITWEDEYIHRLHKTLAGHLELYKRYQALENTFKIIDDNLQLYIGFNNHRESSRLEWIIIILIIIEVLDTFLSKLL